MRPGCRSIRVIVGGLLLILTGGSISAQTPSYTKTNDGIIVYTAEVLPGQAKALRLQVVNDNIIRVTASPVREFAATKSLALAPRKIPLPEFKIAEDNNAKTVSLKLANLSATVQLSTGRILFFDRLGKPLLAERQGRRIEPTVYEGEKTFSLYQAFETTPDDAWYGLGQHQDGIMNYRGYQVFLFQNNSEVGVPFLVSKLNYGILWDNASLTRVGDTRPYKELSALQLFSVTNEPGWLTATYFNHRDNNADILMQKAESEIKYEFLGDSKMLLPASFKPETGKIVWQGSMASAIDGVHKLRLTYGGYLKVWIDNKLLLDRWRQAWNPGSAILDLNFEKGRKLPVRIEWIPDGGESYVTAKCLEPADSRDENMFAFQSEAGKQEDYYFMAGKNMDEVISGYRTLTGKATLLPVWAYGFWQSRERYRSQQEILNTVQEFRKKGIPIDNIVQDWFYWKENDWGSQDFDAARFPSPDSMIKALHDRYHTRFMISVWPKFYEGTAAYRDFDSKGWLYKRNIADRQRDWVGPGYVSTFYDAFNENAQKGFWELIQKKIYNKGVDAWWMDASEPDILSNVSPQKRKGQMYPLAAGPTSENLNAYPLVNAKGIYEGQRSVDPNKRVFILTRSGFSGMQRYAAATWSGDIASRWHDMKTQISAGVNFSMSGLPYWTMDIGGFATERRYSANPDSATIEEWRELNTRWYQFGAFVPLFRVHGQAPVREIFNVSPPDHPAYQTMLNYNRLRYRLLPYIYSLAGQTYHRDYTIMRGLVMDFPHDETAGRINDQYMFGPALMINPVYTYQARSRPVYLPKGEGWYDWYTGEFTEGGKTIDADAPYERMPIFVRAGSIIPFGPALQYTTEKKADTVTLYVYGGRDCQFTLYEDEGVNYNYEKDQLSTITFFYTEKDHNLVIDKRAGAFPGMLTKRYFRIKYVTPGKPLTLNPERRDGILVKYSGTEKTVPLPQ